MNPFDVPDKSVHDLGVKILTALAFLSAVGGLSAALTKALEDFSWVKMAFNRNFLTAWLQQRLTLHDKKKQRIFGLRGVKLDDPTKTPPVVHAAWKQMVLLCAAGDDRALLELEVDQICGQLNSAAQLTLAYPALYRDLFGVLTAGALPADIALVAQGQPAVPPANPLEIAQERRDAQTRISSFIQRSVDALHIRLAERWRWWQQVASFLIGALITEAAMVFGGYVTDSSLETVVKVLLAAVVTSFLAPMARDITAAVKNWGG